MIPLANVTLRTYRFGLSLVSVQFYPISVREQGDISSPVRLCSTIVEHPHR